VCSALVLIAVGIVVMLVLVCKYVCVGPKMFTRQLSLEQYINKMEKNKNYVPSQIAPHVGVSPFTATMPGEREFLFFKYFLIFYIWGFV
jgi:hypothetical protein